MGFHLFPGSKTKKEKVVSAVEIMQLQTGAAESILGFSSLSEETINQGCVSMTFAFGGMLNPKQPERVDKYST